MPKIRPISDLRNNFTQLSKSLHEENEPIFLTRNGVGDIVVMSISYYEKLLAKYEVYQKLDAAETEIKDGALGKDYKSVIRKAKAKINA
ncbi:MAG: type II toxin-antitoxin system Phd/YefM family antitoxin [Spirochaetales bacterium]|nr:type II toxin-antitoxin system Phd/YefM family antitoxin [Spirochaetales bacterium]